MVAFVAAAGIANIVTAWTEYASRPQWLQFGSGSAQDAGDNALASPASQGRAAGVTTAEMTTVTGDTYRIEGTLTAVGAINVTEVGVFDAQGSGSPATGGSMDIYADFAAISLANGDSIEFTIDVVLA